MTRAQTQQTLRQLPAKWALALLALIVVYAFAQPALNSRLGWNLPSLARLMGEPEPKKTIEKDSDKTSKANSSKSPKSKSSKDSRGELAPATEGTAAEQAAVDGDEQVGQQPDDRTTLTTAQEPPSAIEQSSSSKPKNGAPTTKKAASSEPKRSGEAPPKADQRPKPADSDAKLLYGILKETSRDHYVSVEGLQYNPGSEEGHRLKHLEKHLQDMPDRPGKHGVFDGEMKDALRLIDDAFARGKRAAKGVSITEDNKRTVYEVPFTKPIGYIGGRDGKRIRNPPAKRLKLVVEGNVFITAFPF